MATEESPPETARERRRRERAERRGDATPTSVAAVARAVVPLELRRYLTGVQRMWPGNQVTLLRRGEETFPAMLAAIAGARRQVLLETYILEDDRTGNRFAEALRERARAGVDVRLLFDGIGGMGLSGAWIDALRRDGVRVLEYHPIAPWRSRWNLTNRDHRKILVVDDEVAFTGGLNISDDYAAVADGGKGWHDLHCALRGPIVLELSRLFRRTWLRHDGSPYPAPPRASTRVARGAAGEGAWARVLENSLRRRRRVIRRAYANAIDGARRRVLLENAYFLPEGVIRRALARAVRRGVEVHVIVPGQSDVKAVELAGLYVFRRLTRMGVQIHRHRGAMMHAKAAVIDGVWSTIGSYNFDARSLFYNLEVVAEIADPAFGAVMSAQLEADLRDCDPFDEHDWTRLPWWKKALAWLAFQFEKYL